MLLDDKNVCTTFKSGIQYEEIQTTYCLINLFLKPAK